MDPITLNVLTFAPSSFQNNRPPIKEEYVEDIDHPTAPAHTKNVVNQPDQLQSNFDEKQIQTPQEQPLESAKQAQRTCCGGRFTRMQCSFLIAAIVLVVALVIGFGIMIGMNWVKNSVTAKARPRYTTITFVTPQGNRITTTNLEIEEKFFIKSNTKDTFLITKIEPPAPKTRNLQQTDDDAVATSNPPAFVSITDGAKTAIATSSEDIELLVDSQAINNEIQQGENARLLAQENKEQTVEQIRQEVAKAASVDPDQVSITEETYVNLITNDKNQLVVEEDQSPRLLDQTVAAPTTTSTVTATDKTTTKVKVQDKVVNQKASAKIAADIGGFFKNVQDKFKKYKQRIEKQTKSQFKTTNNLLASIEVMKKLSQNHVEIRREYEPILYRKPKDIKNTLVIPKTEYEAFKHCHEHSKGKYCTHRFIERVENPFRISEQSRNRPQHHKVYRMYRITIHDKDYTKKQHQPQNHAVLPKPDTKKTEDKKKITNTKAQTNDKPEIKKDAAAPADKKIEDKKNADNTKNTVKETKPIKINEEKENKKKVEDKPAPAIKKQDNAGKQKEQSSVTPNQTVEGEKSSSSATSNQNGGQNIAN